MKKEFGLIIIREKKAPEIPEKELAVIYADSVLLHYAIFGKMLEGKDNLKDAPEIIRQISNLDFDTDPVAFHASRLEFSLRRGLIPRTLPVAPAVFCRGRLRSCVPRKETA